MANNAIAYTATIEGTGATTGHRIKIEVLHERPSPSSDWTARQPHARWVARMTKRLAPTGVGKSASHAEAWNLGVFHVRVCLGCFRHT